MERREVIEVVAGVIWRQGKVLISRRPPHKRHGGLWEFPGGKVEPGETHHWALERELREELGITTRTGALYETASHVLGERRLLVSFYRSEIISGQVAGLEGQQICWVWPGQLAGYCFPPADRSIIARLGGRVN